MSRHGPVKMWEEETVIPTYPVGEPIKHPMFLEKRVYQGSSGKVYPYPVIDKIYGEKEDRTYRLVWLENDYLKVAIMPELGGRIYRALDKTNGYDFVYYNRVIKPALVGIAGPWIAGGIEFNWPQHHRPSTFLPVEYTLEEGEDGSKTVWVGEIDRMYGTKGMAGFTMYPDKAYLEIRGLVYNRTSMPQTFLWWANPAVAVNEHYKSIFPPDVHAVFDHGKRAVSKFPIATGEYYKVDYSAGVDISYYKNIPVPTSYMVYHSDYDFVGGYDYGKQAGVMHVANHHISPGKKLWTWGTGNFGQVWIDNLTDEDGPYVELMTGVFTDNQPDFAWLMPFESKTFKQYFMPYKEVGEVKNASIDAMVNLDLDGDRAKISIYTTADYDVRIVLTAEGRTFLDERVKMPAATAHHTEAAVDPAIEPHKYRVQVLDETGRELVAYSPVPEQPLKTPEPAKAAPPPAEVQTNEELYLIGLHLEQYRHATYDPDPYYLEGLKRDPGDTRINNAYGLLLLRRGLFKESEPYFRRAIERLQERNPNPYDGEPFYNLGLSLTLQGRYDEAVDAYYKAVWNAAWQESGFFALAQLAAMRGDFGEALELASNAIVRNAYHGKARALKCAALRRLGRFTEAARFAEETLEVDRLDFAAYYELAQAQEALGDGSAADATLAKLRELTRGSAHVHLEVSTDYAEAGLWDEASDLLQMVVGGAADSKSVHPMVYYHLGYYSRRRGDEAAARRWYELASNADPDYCFPTRLYSILVLEDAMAVNPADPRAPYYLGNLFYDKKQYERAISLWERARDLDPDFATVHRNLALGYFNKRSDAESALASLEKAFACDPSDARLLFELDQLRKRLGHAPQERLAALERHRELVEERDDLYTEFVTLHNQLGRHEEALGLLMRRRFYPWEGGEGKVTGQYVLSHVELAKQAIREQRYAEAIDHLKQAQEYPANLGEGKLPIAEENDIEYWLGVAYRGLGDEKAAVEWFTKAASGRYELTAAMFYNDLRSDLLFYQGLALLALGRGDEAMARFNRLHDYGEQHLFDDVKIDYFAVSLPDFLLFDQDLNVMNQVHCRYLMGLGYLGRGDLDRAKRELAAAHALDRNHLGVAIHLEMLEQGWFTDESSGTEAEDDAAS